jgi:hypothetical protein
MTACATAIFRPASPNCRRASRRPRTGAARHASIRPSRKSRCAGRWHLQLAFPPAPSRIGGSQRRHVARRPIWRSPKSLQAHHTGLFRVMAEPDERHRAASPDRQRVRAELAGDGAADRSSSARSMPPTRARRRSCSRSAAPAWALPMSRTAGVVPWHAADGRHLCPCHRPAAPLADRYVMRATLAIANGQPVPRGGDRRVHQAAPGDGARRCARADRSTAR